MEAMNSHVVVQEDMLENCAKLVCKVNVSHRFPPTICVMKVNPEKRSTRSLFRRIFCIRYKLCLSGQIRYLLEPSITISGNVFYPIFAITAKVYNFSDIDECTSQPCFNNGTCVDQVNAWNCVCDDGYTGQQCQTGMLWITWF